MIKTNICCLFWIFLIYQSLQLYTNGDICVLALDRFLLGANWMYDRDIVFNIKDKVVSIYDNIKFSVLLHEQLGSSSNGTRYFLENDPLCTFKIICTCKNDLLACPSWTWNGMRYALRSLLRTQCTLWDWSLKWNPG